MENAIIYTYNDGLFDRKLCFNCAIKTAQDTKEGEGFQINSHMVTQEEANNSHNTETYYCFLCDKVLI